MIPRRKKNLSSFIDLSFVAQLTLPLPPRSFQVKFRPFSDNVKDFFFACLFHPLPPRVVKIDTPFKDYPLCVIWI